MNKPKQDLFLQSLKSAVARVPEGANLLKLADALRCRILLSKSCAMDGYDGRYIPATATRRHRIELSPAVSAIDLVFILAHELRHMWQYHVLERNFDPDLMPKGHLIRTRIIEGDAYAFETYFMRQLRKPHQKINPADWQQSYMAFQTTDDAHGYDLDSIKQETLVIEIIDSNAAVYGDESTYASAFNKAAADELAPIRQILKAGLNKDSPVYAPENIVALTESMMRPSTLRKVEKLEQRIKVIHPKTMG